MLTIFSTTEKLLQGFSYWKITLTSGKVITEGQTSFDLLRGTRSVDWALDVVGAGDIARIKEITLCTLQGDATLSIDEPYTAFQLKQGTRLFFGDSGQVMQAQIIGKVDNKETGDCTCAIWDVLEQRLYIDHCTNIRDFAPWRENVARIGAINLDVVGVRLT